MKLRGGYDVRLAGRPSGEIETLAEPGALHIPLRSRRLHFTQVTVAEGRRVRTGQPLAKDTANYSLPLIAPAAGTVRLGAVDGHLTLEDVEFEPEVLQGSDGGGEARAMSEGMRRYKLFALGAWRFARDAHTSEVPDPFGMPAAIVVSTARHEPFVASGSALLAGRVPDFVRGLEHLQALSRAERVYVAIPKGRSALAAELRDALREIPCYETVSVPSKYPFGDLRVLARGLRLRKRPDAPVWGFGVAGILAIDDAITFSRPSVTNVLSVAGPGAVAPRHVRAAVGHPLEDIVGPDASRGPCRVIDGGALSGSALPPGQVGLDVECQGLTLVPEHTDREFLGFMRPGFFRGSYSRCFLSSLRPGFSERLTTGVRGERRPCVSCGFCEEVCPAGIMPHLIHKYLYKGDIDGAERMRIDLCLECGLCSYVCPAKIELRSQFIEAREKMRQEMHAEAEGQAPPEVRPSLTGVEVTA